MTVRVVIHTGRRKEKTISPLQAASLAEKTGYAFSDRSLLTLALTHSSYSNEGGQAGVHNERLEFLGDAVLEMVTSDFLYHQYPDMPEGKMTRLRASLVCETALAYDARAIGLPDYLIMGKGEEATGGRERDSVISDALEAVIGAVYLDGGLGCARTFILSNVLNDIENKQLFVDSKTILQEAVQAEAGTIRYELTGESGPSHRKRFAAAVYVNGELSGAGEGPTKKAAEQQAAYEAIKKMRHTCT